MELYNYLTRLDSILSSYGCICHDIEVSLRNTKLKIFDPTAKIDFVFTVCPDYFDGSYQDFLETFEGFCISLILGDLDESALSIEQQFSSSLWLVNVETCFKEVLSDSNSIPEEKVHKYGWDDLW